MGEVDVALDIMAELVQRHTKKIAPFGIFVKVSVHNIVSIQCKSAYDCVLCMQYSKLAVHPKAYKCYQNVIFLTVFDLADIQ